MKFLPSIAELPPDDILIQLKKKEKLLSDALRRISDKRKKYPEGRLRIHKTKHKYLQYYHITKSSAPDGTYIP